MGEVTLPHGDPLPAGGVGPRTIGPYRLLRRLGEGGMGEVWLAEQTEPIRREVAVKLVKAGMDTRRVVARFEAERQALALMDHPAIAKVLDGGSTPEGRPYFVMERVAGVPLGQYCDEHRLGTRQRLELLARVCDGVQHAHQKAIIHRDLKPSNVLVANVDGVPQPRIIDFGIAKATGARLSENALTTEYGALMGTPEYMSPEQADPASDDVDTRADVYALGVMLYELLSGALPFASQALRGGTPQELRRKLVEIDPPTPSARLRGLGGEAAEVASLRGTAPDTLAGELRGDLDAIVMKAMEKDRDRRYASAAELAADLRRALADQPVEARPASAGYRLKKYVRRHRAGVALAATVGLLLAAFTVALAFQVRTVTRERDRANREAEAANRIAGFMVGLFKVSNPSEARGRSVTARELLDQASREIQAGLDQDPLLRARLQHTMGVSYRELGLYTAARPLLERALESRTRLLGPAAAPTLESRLAMSTLGAQEHRGAEVVPFDRETVALARQALGPRHPVTLDASQRLGVTLADLPEPAGGEGVALLREVIEADRQALGAEAEQTLGARLDLADALSHQGRFAEAGPLRAGVLEIFLRGLGVDHPKTVALLINTAADLNVQGKFAEAEPLHLQALEASRRVYGPEHPATLEIMLNLGVARSAQHRHAEAEQIEREALAIERRVRGPGGWLSAIALYDLTCNAALDHRREDALRALREGVAVGFPPDLLAGIEQDTDLASLRGQPDFEALVAQAKANPRTR